MTDEGDSSEIKQGRSSGVGDNLGGDKGFVVRDRRRFESDGRVKADEGVDGDKHGSEKRESGDIKPSAEEAARVAASALGEGSPVASDQNGVGSLDDVSGKGSSGSEEVSFSAFVMSLATQALMQLGVVAPPQGYELPQDVHGAKQTIDLLQMLQEKTKGNLDEQESALIEDILHNVRLAFVRRS